MPELNFDDTIAALATPPGEGGIGVIRISGPGAFLIISKVFHPDKGSVDDFKSHTIHLGRIMARNGEVIDQALMSIFRAPHSYTGQHVAELSCHGGVWVIRKILHEIFQAGARPAEPGEFTKRAFLSGKLDLPQAEAVLDLIRAKSDKSLSTALRQLSGALSLNLKSLKDRMMKIYAHMEAFLDFPEEDLEIYSDSDLFDQMQKIEKDLTSLIESFQRSAVFREGLSAVIVGRPNVGKSSFFNALLARDRALVSEFPGTTRDVIEESISIAGIPIRLTDTAGLSPGMNHPIDVMSMEKTKKAISNADFYIFLLDGSSPLQEEDNLAYQEIEKIKGSFPSRKVVVLITKSDLEQKLQTKVAPCFSEGRPPIEISSKTLQGFETLEKRLEDFITANCIEPEIETITRLRHLRALEQGREALCAAKRAFLEKKSLEFVIADLKRALDSMRELIGEIYSEDLLDVIFSEFCIGK